MTAPGIPRYDCSGRAARVTGTALSPGLRRNSRISSVGVANPYIPTLAVDGTLVLVGYLGDLEPPLNSAPLVLQRKAVAGSLIGGLSETLEMLDFCGQHGISCDIEMIKMDQINDAYKRLVKNDVRYRFVIDMKSLS